MISKLIQYFNMDNQEQQKQNQVHVSPPRKVPAGLNKYLKQQKTLHVQYKIVKEMISLIERPKQAQFYDTFKHFYNDLSKQIRKTTIFQLLNYTIWNDETIPIQVREKTQFFRTVSQWIIIYELKVNDLKGLQGQIQFLNQFFAKQTHNMFQKIVLIDQIHEDLLELLGERFWNPNSEELLTKPSTKQEAAEILKFLSSLVSYYNFFEPEKDIPLHSVQMYMLRSKSQHYRQFMLKAIEYVLSVNSGKKEESKYLQKYQQTQLTRISLIFLQRPDITPKQCINIVKLMMLRTSKVARLAMVVDYVKFYDYLEKSQNQQVVQSLEQMLYFRELIIGRSQIDQAGLIANSLDKPLQVVNIAARSRERILISHQPIFGAYSIIQIEILIEGGDINLAMYFVKDAKQTEYWKQSRSSDRRVDIILKEEGLYILEFDNTYSWIKPKKVQCKLEQYCLGASR